MTISRAVQGHLAKGDYDAIENDWLAHLAADPADLDYFVGAGRALIGVAEDERARFLLELVDGELAERGLWGARLKLLRRVGSILFAEPDLLHPAILESLGRQYGHLPHFEGFVEAMGLHRATHDIPKTWEKVGRLESLVVFDIGAVVMMEGKGAGRVVEVNLGLESFKIDFERHSGLMVGFRAAPKLLQPLPEDHVLRRKLEAPEGLTALASSDPPALLRDVLVSFGRPMTAGEVREVLAGVVSEAQWTSWWGAARRHPQVLTGAAGRQTYSWADSGADALDSVWLTFRKTSDPRKKMDQLRRDGERDLGLRKKMAAELAEIAAKAAPTDPGLAFELWFALERSGGAPEDVEWSAENLLDTVDLGRLFAGIAERLLRERAYVMLRERREDWPAIYLQAMTREEDPRALDLLADGVAGAAPEDYARFLDQTLSQPYKAPAAFVWLVERAAVDAALRERNPLRLLQHLLTGLTRDELAPYRVRLAAQCESGGTLPRLLSHLTEEQAPQAEEAIQRAPGLEGYQRDQLLAALTLRFPSLQKDEAVAMLYALPASIETKRQELKHMAEKEIPANRKAIEEARAMGDLRENFEYKAARQRHEYLSARAEGLNRDLGRSRPIETKGLDTSEVRIGTRVHLRDSTGAARTLTILGPWESKPEEDIFSYESELAMSLLGKKPGDTVDVTGKSYQITGIEPWDR